MIPLSFGARGKYPLNLSLNLAGVPQVTCLCAIKDSKVIMNTLNYTWKLIIGSPCNIIIIAVINQENYLDCIVLKTSGFTEMILCYA